MLRRAGILRLRLILALSAQRSILAQDDKAPKNLGQESLSPRSPVNLPQGSPFVSLLRLAAREPGVAAKGLEVVVVVHVRDVRGSEVVGFVEVFDRLVGMSANGGNAGEAVPGRGFA